MEKKTKVTARWNSGFKFVVAFKLKYWIVGQYWSLMKPTQKQNYCNEEKKNPGTCLSPYDANKKI